MDPFAKMKEAAREGWAGFVRFEPITASVAPKLVRFAGVAEGQEVLDIGCGTGVVALTAARRGARVTGGDLTPALLERARENAEIAGLKVEFREADVEALPFPDAHFDTVLSQFGHMFGPRPEVALGEMLRVLRPGGTIAFSTWPPELFTGRMFVLMGQYGPPPPEGAAPPVAWGDPGTVRERFGDRVDDLTFDRGRMEFQTISPGHMRQFLVANAGPVQAIANSLAETPDRLREFEREFDALIGLYFHDNIVRQDFLMTRARKR